MGRGGGGDIVGVAGLVCRVFSKGLNTMLPDYSAFFRRERASPLHFRVRRAGNHAHDIVFLSSYLHDARFSPDAVTRRGPKLRIVVVRDCWELGWDRPDAPGLFTAKSRLTIGPVTSMRWESADLSRIERELEIEHIYLGAAHWESPDASELVISAPHDGWKLCISLGDECGDIRLDDLETPYSGARRED